MRLATVTIALIAIASPLSASGPKLADRPSEVRGDEITPAQQKAVEKGLEWLAGHQAKNGGYGGGAGFGGGVGGHAGITGLAGLAFMSAGNLPGRGKYGENVQKCLDFVMASVQESGLITSDNTNGVMYGHGFAALFLAEVYGMTGNQDVKEKLDKSIKLIQKTQNKEGGWRYTPAPYDADISVTICQVMALRAARDSGIKVEKEVITKAIEYVRRCQSKDGGFAYQANGGGSAPTRSGAGVAALYYAGIFEGDEIKRGLEYLIRFVPGKGQGMQGHYFYGHYYGAQAMFLAGGDYWAKWYPAIRDELIKKQANGGNWSGDFNDDYATSMALIILQMPNRYLPVFHGKGPGS